jgi:hypothetical protein
MGPLRFLTLGELKPQTAAAEDRLQLEVGGLYCGDFAALIPDLNRALAECGCCLVRWRTGHEAALQCRFEIELRSAADLYAGLIDAGLELTQRSHHALTELCVLRKYSRSSFELKRAVHVHLTVRFVDETDLSPLVVIATGAA